MALSPNYSWSEPDNSSLVKNGAADIRTLGDAIDTSVWNVGFGQAGKNKIINGDFGIWARGTSFSATGYTSDRWYFGRNSTTTVSQQTFTAGTAPVTGYEGTYFARVQRTAGASGDSFIQRIEDVRTFANQTITVSFWAKAASAVTLGQVYVEQQFGSGGSGSVVAGSSGGLAITTSWQRFSFNVNVPSVSGKTIGTSSYLQVIFDLTAGMGTSFTLDIWGVQVERGSKATPFQTATGTIQGELAACQRYYYQFASGATKAIGIGTYNTTTEAYTALTFPVTMRTTPTLSATTGTAYYRFQRSGSSDDFNSLTMEAAHTNGTWLYNNTEMSGTAGIAGVMKTQDAASSLAFSAEL